jgi:hypothetical protein
MAKVRDILAETQKNYETLKKKYNEEVDIMRATSEEENQARTERIRDLESSLRAAEENLELARQKWDKDQAISK